MKIAAILAAVGLFACAVPAAAFGFVPLHPVQVCAARERLLLLPLARCSAGCCTRINATLCLSASSDALLPPWHRNTAAEGGGH